MRIKEKYPITVVNSKKNRACGGLFPPNSSQNSFSYFKIAARRAANFFRTKNYSYSKKKLELSVLSRVQNKIRGISEKNDTFALGSSKFSNFLVFESCAFIFSGISEGVWNVHFRGVLSRSGLPMKGVTRTTWDQNIFWNFGIFGLKSICFCPVLYRYNSDQ